MSKKSTPRDFVRSLPDPSTPEAGELLVWLRREQQPALGTWAREAEKHELRRACAARMPKSAIAVRLGMTRQNLYLRYGQYLAQADAAIAAVKTSSAETAPVEGPVTGNAEPTGGGHRTTSAGLPQPLFGGDPW